MYYKKAGKEQPLCQVLAAAPSIHHDDEEADEGQDE